ncbi:MAG: hypothetical protein A2X52_10425 [Candidatus Rokubacteria bacterium GWC2_70_16]|nr:MAG: hypothetical protein A2X52_10425 [Candidatus Rokubacteria bacterium GWC2_70_16]
MTAVTRRLMLFFLFSLAAVACESVPEKQWYKPAGAYTLADFRNDEKACTRDRKLDEECLKARGWVPLSGDVAPTKAEPTPTRTRPTGRY